MEERISKLEDRILEMIRVEKDRKLTSKKMKKFYDKVSDSIGNYLTHKDNGYARRRKEGKGNRVYLKK